jgi:hypothetical protein
MRLGSLTLRMRPVVVSGKVYLDRSSPFLNDVGERPTDAVLATNVSHIPGHKEVSSYSEST